MLQLDFFERTDIMDTSKLERIEPCHIDCIIDVNGAQALIYSLSVAHGI